MPCPLGFAPQDTDLPPLHQRHPVIQESDLSQAARGHPSLWPAGCRTLSWASPLEPGAPSRGGWGPGKGTGLWAGPLCLLGHLTCYHRQLCHCRHTCPPWSSAPATVPAVDARGQGQRYNLAQPNVPQSRDWQGVSEDAARGE